MEIILDNDADKIRQTFIEKFVNRETQTFKKISKRRLCSDGYCYTGYLWDTLKSVRVCSEKFVESGLEKLSRFYILWDIHSKDFIFIEDYWKYPKEAVLSLNFGEFIKIKKDLPEDIYIFDGTFNSGYVLTHEYLKKDKRYCLEIYGN